VARPFPVATWKKKIRVSDQKGGGGAGNMAGPAHLMTTYAFSPFIVPLRMGVFFTIWTHIVSSRDNPSLGRKLPKTTGALRQ